MVIIRSNENLECPICLQDIKHAVETGCGHMYCGRCILEVWRTSATPFSLNCPICRRKVTLLLTCYTAEETNTTREIEIRQREEITAKLNEYNRYQGNENLSIWNQMRELPVLLRHIWAELFTAQGLAFMSKLRIMILFFIGFVYVIVPIDLIPEAILGIFGLVDDFFVVAFILIQAGITYRTHATNNY